MIPNRKARMSKTPDHDPRYDRAQSVEGAKARYTEHDNGYGEVELEEDLERLLEQDNSTQDNWVTTRRNSKNTFANLREAIDAVESEDAVGVCGEIEMTQEREDPNDVPIFEGQEVIR